MTPSLQKISDSIPQPSEHVKHLFNLSTSPDNNVPYGIFARYVYASGAIACSLVNSIGYAVVIASRLVTLPIYRDLKDCTEKSSQDASHVFHSLQFVATMTTYLFLSIINRIIRRSAFPMKLEVPYELHPEYWAPVLKMQEPLGFTLPPHEVLGLKFKLFANTENLNIDNITDINLLLGVLFSRKDLVLIFTPDENSAYLLHRVDERIKTAVMAGTLKSFDLAPVEVPIINTLPPPIQKPSVDFISPPPVVLSTTSETIQIPSPAEDLLKSIHKLECSQSSEQDLKMEDFEVLKIPPSEVVEPLTTFGLVGLKIQSAWGRVVGFDARPKEMKYRHILADLYKAVTQGDGRFLYKQAFITADSPLKSKCIRLCEILTTPQNYTDVRLQLQDFIYALREAQQLVQVQDNKACRNWIEFLAYHRFSKIKLYGYCKNLVESVSEKFKEPLTLENFWEQFTSRVEQVKKISVEQGLPYTVEALQNLVGHLNMKDFLIASNVPYIYGQIKQKGKETTILRHGTPFNHKEPLGVLKRLWWGESGNSIPEATPDYIAFINAAANRNEKILHLVLENEDWKYHGDESSRVKARLALQSKDNFFPLAFRLDGPFIQPEKYTPRTIKEVMDDFSNQMFGAKTGYHVPEKLQKEGVLRKEEFQKFMESVQSTFFKDQENFETLGDFQAFVVLTYAEITLSLCDTLDIAYLEAHCKDDIDRGNAIKAIIVLLHLYRTQKFAEGSEALLNKALEELMVNIISAPLIVKKKPIIKSRSVYIENVIEVMKRTVKKTRVPELKYTGNFNVLSEPYQGITPTGVTCRNQKEYQQFLDSARSNEIVFNAPLEENIVEKCFGNYKTTKAKERIAHQVKLEFIRMNMWVNNSKLERKTPEQFNISEYLINELEKVEIKDEAALHVLSVFNQAIGQELVTSLEPLFNNESLGYIISPDNDRMMEKDSSAGLYLTLEQDKASINFVLLFKIISPDLDGKIIGRVRVALNIPDHRKAGAIVTTSVDPL